MKKYLVNGKEVSEEEFIKELLYALYLERLELKDNPLHSIHRFNTVTAVFMVLNTDNPSTFFEVYNSIFKCYTIQK